LPTPKKYNARKNSLTAIFVRLTVQSRLTKQIQKQHDAGIIENDLKDDILKKRKRDENSIFLALGSWVGNVTRLDSHGYC
jgi:hypothetical protein